MRIVHFSDLHLGYRQFTRLTPSGRNQREQDVSNTFFQAVRKIEEVKPDLILVAGDVFHMTRPSNPSILDAMHGFQRLAKVAPTVVISGNHEDKKNQETACILPILKRVGCHVVWERMAEVDPALGMTSRLPFVVCVPERCALSWPGQTGDILLLHGEVAGALPISTPNAIPRERFQADKWQYIALGHYHVRSDIWPNGGYSGSLDYVSTDIWAEARTGVPKGFIEYDTEKQVRTFHPVETRPVHDLPIIDALDWAFAKVEAAVIAAAEYNGLPEGAIVRQTVVNLTHPEWRGHDKRAIAQAGKRFLTFEVRPSWRTEERRARSPKERKASLESDVETFLRARRVPADVPLDKLVEVGLQYVRAAVNETSPTEIAE